MPDSEKPGPGLVSSVYLANTSTPGHESFPLSVSTVPEVHRTQGSDYFRRACSLYYVPLVGWGVV